MKLTTVLSATVIRIEHGGIFSDGQQRTTLFFPQADAMFRELRLNAGIIGTDHELGDEVIVLIDEPEATHVE